MTAAPLRALALASFPVEAASTRFRLVQLLPRLSEAGIEVSVRPFLDSATWRTLYDRTAISRTTLGLLKGAASRVVDLAGARHADVVLVLREAMIVGPPIVELVAPALGRCPLVLDLDDATWVGYDSPTYGRLGRLLKWPGKSLNLIDRADTVICGNRYIASFVASRGRPSALVPVVVDTEVFRPPADQRSGQVPVVGWVGTHSTFAYLEPIVRALAAVARTHPFRLRIIGAGPARLSVDGVDVEHLEWDLDREAADFAAFDIGLYPLPANDPWAMGKSALKSVQFLASGVPFVASPVGAAAEVGVSGTTHFLAKTTSDWVEALGALIGDSTTRNQMGVAGRNHALRHHTTAIGAGLLGDVLREVTA